MSPLTSYGVQRRLRSQSMALAHFYPPVIVKNNTMKTKDIKQHKCIVILGKAFEISTKLEETLKGELKVHLTSSPHLQFFKIIYCNLNGTKAAVAGLMLFSLVFFRELLLQGRSKQSLRKVTKLLNCGGRKSSCFEWVMLTKCIIAN